MNQVAEIAQQAGVLMITAVATIGMLELPGYHVKGELHHMITANQPIISNQPVGAEDNNVSLRREREETGPHYTSYGVAQRTPGRTGWL